MAEAEEVKMVVRCSFDKLVKVSDLKPHPKNRNKHPKAQIERFVKILLYSGVRRPVRVSKLSEFMTSGHGMIEAFKIIGWKFAPVNFQDYDSEEQEIADLNADNALGHWSELDLSEINTDFVDLGPDFDIDMLGIEKFVLEPADKGGGIGDDEIPTNVPTRCKLGDLWQMGKHRLVCGDSTDKLVHERLFGKEPAAVIMITDPPYGVSYDPTWRDKALEKRMETNSGTVAKTKGGVSLAPARTGKVSNDHEADWTPVWMLCSAQVAYVWHASSFTDVVKKSLETAEYQVRQMIIWNKDQAPMGRSAYHWKHEPCWYAVKEGKNANWLGDRKQKTVWDGPSPTQIFGKKNDGDKEKTIHPTQKPLFVYEIPLKNHTKMNDIVFDPFLGSGSAVIAAHKMSRRCFGIELDPKYCDVVLTRWEKFSGEKAKCVSQGIKTRKKSKGAV